MKSMGHMLMAVCTKKNLYIFVAPNFGKTMLGFADGVIRDVTIFYSENVARNALKPTSLTNINRYNRK